MNPNAQGIKILKIVSTYFNIFHNRNPWSGKYVIDLKELLVCVGRILKLILNNNCCTLIYQT